METIVCDIVLIVSDSYIELLSCLFAGVSPFLATFCGRNAAAPKTLQK